MSSPSTPQLFKLSRHAMGTVFEFALVGDDPRYLQSAAEEAMEEVERLDRQLSLFNPTSDLSRINAAAAYEPVRLESRLFRLLQIAQELHRETEGAFDIATGALKSCWGFKEGTGRIPTPEELSRATENSGFHHVVLEERNQTVSFTHEGVALDLGALGKGYAVDRAVDLLVEKGLDSALLHGGGSTVYALGAPPDQPGWKVSLPGGHKVGGSRACVSLTDRALSVSSDTYQSFESEGTRFGHIIDPRDGEPARAATTVTVMAPCATDSDALSTAFYVLGASRARQYCETHPLVTAVLETPDGQSVCVGQIGHDADRSGAIVCRNSFNS